MADKTIKEMNQLGFHDGVPDGNGGVHIVDSMTDQVLAFEDNNGEIGSPIKDNLIFHGHVLEFNSDKPIHASKVACLWNILDFEERTGKTEDIDNVKAVFEVEGKNKVRKYVGEVVYGDTTTDILHKTFAAKIIAILFSPEVDKEEGSE